MSPLNDVSGGELIVYSAGGTTVLWCPKCQTQVKRITGPIMLIELFTNHTTCPFFEGTVARFLEDRRNANDQDDYRKNDRDDLIDDIGWVLAGSLFWPITMLGYLFYKVIIKQLWYRPTPGEKREAAAKLETQMKIAETRAQNEH